MSKHRYHQLQGPSQSQPGWSGHQHLHQIRSCLHLRACHIRCYIWIIHAPPASGLQPYLKVGPPAARIIKDGKAITLCTRW